jgi:hypothetical protein
MKLPIIEWNKSTWYSALAAALFFIAVLVLGFYMGRMYESQKTADMIQALVSHEQRQMYITHTDPGASTTTYSRMQ